MLIKVDLADGLTGDQMEVASLACDRTVVAIRGAGSRLVDSLERDRTIESTVGATSVRLRVGLEADTVPAAKEVVYKP